MNYHFEATFNEWYCSCHLDSTQFGLFQNWSGENSRISGQVRNMSLFYPFNLNTLLETYFFLHEKL
eukprot:snap_masked-scaffold_56-processed-gene-1.43-mRNA-1 protein AED:1.00 eAED:1.00 QI:0/0/0/0/1/1/2/0/65